MKTAIFYEHIDEGAKQRGISLTEASKAMKSFGIDSVDISFDVYNDEIKSVLKAAGLGVACMHNNFDFTKSSDLSSAELKKAFKMVDIAAELGLKNILIVPGFIRENEDYNTVRENIVENLNILCGYAGEKDIDIMLEDYDADFAPYHTLNELVWFLERVKPLKIAFDSGNFKYSGEDELAALDKLIDKVEYLHCKDRSNIENCSNPQMNIFGEKMYPCAVGSGYIQIEKVIERLFDNGYGGDIVIEHFGACDQLGFAEKSAEYLNDIIDAKR